MCILELYFYSNNKPGDIKPRFDTSSVTHRQNMDTNDPESEYATIEPYTTITYMDLAQRRDNELPYNHLTVRRKDNAKIGSS